MFSNQITARELLNGSQSQSQSTQDRVMPSDFSQLQNAQMTQLEYSLANSQEFFSQDQFSSGNGSYGSHRLSAVDKYISKQSKPSLFRSNSQNKISTPRPPQTAMSSQGFDRKSHLPSSNYVETLNMMKTKTKERDERDMLSSIVSIVQECSDEVKNNLSLMKITDKDLCEVLKTSFTSLTQSLDESSKKILIAVKQKDDHACEISELRKELKRKDDQILELLQQKQTSEEESSDSSSIFMDSLKLFLMEQQTKTEQSLQKVLDLTQNQLKQFKEFGSCHRNGIEENNKHIMDLKYSNVGRVQDLEKRVVNELVTLRDEFDRQKHDMENILHSQIHSNHQKHTREIEKHIQKGLTEGLQQSIERQQECFQEKHNELENFCKSQNRAVEKYIKSISSEQTKQLMKQSQDNHKDVDQKMKLVLSNQKDCRDENNVHFSEIKQSIDIEKRHSWQNDNVPKIVQDRLDKLYTCHQSEIKRLREEIESRRNKNSEEKGNELAQENVLQNVYNSKSDEDNFNQNNGIRTRSQAVGSIFKKRSTFLSPKPPKVTTWNSRAIFSRSSPSPVATVRPQRQPTPNTISEKRAERAVQAIQQTTSVLAQQLTDVNSIRRRKNADNANMIVYDNSQTHDSDHLPEQNPVIINTVAKAGKRRVGRKRKVTARKPKEVAKKLEENRKLDASRETAKNAGNIVNLSATKCNEIIRRKAGSVTDTSIASNALYDFHDETSPIPALRQKKMLTNKRTRKSTAVEPVACDSSSDESSASTSSVWSVSDIFGRQVKECVSCPDSEQLGDTSDFLSSPSLMEISCEIDKQICDTVPFNQLVQEQPSHIRKQKRRLYSYDMTMMQFVKHSKTRKY